MFEAYPGFENLPLRVEVDWQRHKRWVVARLEQWPLSHHAVLTCAFEDEVDDGEWLVMNGTPPYRLDTAHKQLHRATIYDTTTRQTTEVYRWKDEGKARIEEMVQRSFKGEGKRHDVARVLRLDALPGEPKSALWDRESCHWLCGPEHWNWIEFARPNDAPFAISQAWASEMLSELWHQPESEARFTWQWAQWSEEERLRELSRGSDWAELRRLVKLVLRAQAASWQGYEGLWWNLDANPQTGELEGAVGEMGDPRRAPDVVSDAMHAWNRRLLDYFASGWRADWVRQYPCVRDFISAYIHNFGIVTVEQAPSAHQQLEAKLALRDWLRDKATPDQIERLLAP